MGSSRTMWLWPSQRATVQSSSVQVSFTCHKATRVLWVGDQLHGAPRESSKGHRKGTHLSRRVDKVAARRRGGWGLRARGCRGRGAGAGVLEAVDGAVLVADGVEAAAGPVRLVVYHFPYEKRHQWVAQRMQPEQRQGWSCKTGGEGHLPGRKSCPKAWQKQCEVGNGVLALVGGCGLLRIVGVMGERLMPGRLVEVALVVDTTEVPAVLEEAPIVVDTAYVLAVTVEVAPATVVVVVAAELTQWLGSQHSRRTW